MSAEEELVELLKNVGLTDKRIDEVCKNKKVSKSFSEIISEGGITKADEKQIALLHSLAVDSKGNEVPRRDLITKGILDGRLTSNLQVGEALKYIKENAETANVEGLNKHAGVGVEVSEETVRKVIEDYMQSRAEEIKAKRYSMVPSLLGEVRKIPDLKWAKPNLFKPIIDSKMVSMVGEKDERDVVKKEKKKLAKKADPASKEKVEERTMFSEGFLGELHKPEESPQKYPELMEEYLKITKGKVLTRFPPEPNGYLHIGHSKAIMVNFGYAQFHKGDCYLRFDDTNPEAEEDVYFESIKDMITWLGFEPWKITYSSDYFDRLYDLAEKLIMSGGAYVCHCTAEEVKVQRGLKSDGTLGGERFPSPYRSRSVEENLKEFRKMKDGAYKSGEATLRMKQDIYSPNPQMWDLVAYRVVEKAHPRTGTKWKIYPTYDFTHCLVDSFEHISHSLCTTEFRLSRESYEWLCDALHVYRPAQREYGRLNITGTVLSKRKIAKLVNEGIVRGWDDPRLYTLEAIRRRGVPPGAILSFINTLGVTTSTTNIQVIRFESAVRWYLDHSTPRLMMVLDPIEVEIENLSEDHEELLEVPYKPGDNVKFSSRKVSFGKRIYIDRSDYNDAVSKEYFRLAPGQPVGLIRVPYNISVSQVIKTPEGHVKKIVAHYDNDPSVHKKPKTYIQWVPKSAAVPVSEVRVQNPLFCSENPQAHPDGFLSDINSHLEEIFRNAVVEPAFHEVQRMSPMNIPVDGCKFNVKEAAGPHTVRFQALRVGYFCVDKDSTDDAIVLNRIVTLKEDAAKA